MTKQSAGGVAIAYVVAVAAVLVWGILGILDMGNVSYAGFTTTPQYVVNQVDAGSPAEAAGLAVGDRITSIGGVAIEDTRGLNRAPRPLPGDVRAIGVERDGQARTVQLGYTSPPGPQRASAWLSVVIGLTFLLATNWARGRVRTRASEILAWLGVCLALAFLAGPYLTSVVLRGAAAAVTIAAIVFGFALLLRFTLAFPSESPFMARPTAKLWIWGPATLIALMFAFLLLAEPAGTTGLNSVVNLLVGLFVIGYFGAALVVLVGRYRAAGAEERERTGLSLMMWGAVVGLVPALLSSIVTLIAPMVVLPGQQYYFLTLVALPVAFALAVVKTGAADRAPAHAGGV